MSAFKQKMARLGVRAGLLAGASAAVLAISGIGATSALAAPECPTAPPAKLEGQGSSLQRIAQENWVSGYASSCPSGIPVEYTSSSSGAALEAFRYKGASTIETTYGFVSSDDAPNVSQIKNAKEATVSSEGGPLIIPVIETSIAVVVHLPTGCTFKTSKGIKWTELNKLFNGTLKQWNELSQTEGASSACNHEITRVVREDGSGTTYQFKNYLSVLETEPSSSAEGPGCGLSTWASLRTVGTSNEPNITWPENQSTCTSRTPVVRKKGGGSVAEWVAGHENTIGYVALPDAKAKGAAVARLQNLGGLTPTYTLPENGSEESNCGERVYTVPTPGRPSGTSSSSPAAETGEEVDWSEVFGAKPAIGSTLYPLCTLTYALSWKHYAKAGYGANSAAIATVTKDYISNYILETGQGVKHWYQSLPSTPDEPEHNVLGAAKLAASRIGN
jgi:ABC-type phosphate transport system substrate-binding protein